MKVIMKRRCKNQPCRSPSPDIANKSVIKSTVIQIQDIKSKMKKAQQKEVKFELQSSISQATPSDNLSIEAKYRHIYEQYNKLKQQHKYLSEQNKLLNQQNSRIVQKEQKNKNIRQFAGNLLNNSQNQALWAKVSLLDQEKKKLEKDLKGQRQKLDQSYKNIQNLRLEQLSLKDALRKVNHSQVPFPPNDVQSLFKVISNNMLTSYEQKVKSYVDELHSRINKVEIMQKILKQKHSRLVMESRVNKTPSSNKSFNNWGNTTAVKCDSHFKQYPSTFDRMDRGDTFPLSSSPIERHFKLQDSTVQKLQQQNNALYDELKLKESEISRLLGQKQKLNQIVGDYEREKKLLIVSTPKFNQINEKIMMVNQINKSKGGAQSRQIQELKEQMQIDRNKFQQQKIELVNKHQYLQKIVNCYQENIKKPQICEQCQRKQDQISKLIVKFKSAEQKYDQNLNQLRKSFQQDLNDYQRKLNHSQSQNSDKFKLLQDDYQKSKKMNKNLEIELNNYMMMLEYIREKVQIQEINGLLNQNNTIYTQCETNYLSERQEYESTVNQFKGQLIVKDQTIASLQTKIGLQDKQIQLLQIELQKVKGLNSDHQANSMNILRSNLAFLSRQKSDSKHKIFMSNTQEVLSRVRSGSDKLDILFQKINNCVHYDLANSQQLR